MKISNALIFPALLLFLSGLFAAQSKMEREIEIQQNVKLIEMPIPQDMPEQLGNMYQRFLPLLKEALKENLSPQPGDRAITFRTTAGIKEIGAAKTQRAIAVITAFRRDSKNEYVASLLLYNYATGDIVSKDDVVQFLKKQILGPLELIQEPKQ